MTQLMKFQVFPSLTHAYTVEPLIKDTLNKGCTHLYGGNTFLPPKEDSLSIVDKIHI